VVNDTRRRRLHLSAEPAEPGRRGPGVLAVSLVIHAVFLVLFVRIVIVPFDLLTPRGKRAAPLVVERIGFLALPRGTQPQREKPRAGGDNLPQRAIPAPAPTPAPSEVPAVIPEAPRQAAAPAGGAGPVVGAGGSVQGIRPEFTDPRIWAPNAPVIVAPMSPKQKIDSVISERLREVEDSLNGMPHERAPGDWTFNHGGKKYGIDQKYIHLGDFSLPTALLALLPLNVTGNPSTYESGKRNALMRSEIQDQAARMARDEDFRSAVKALRDRKEKERQDQQQKKKAAEAGPDKPIPDRP